MNAQIPPENNKLYVFGPFCLDTHERRLLRGDEQIPLARKTFDLLQILVASAGSLLTREELIEALWPDRIVEEQGLTTQMHELRKALGDEDATHVYIETVRGIGYRFHAPVSVENKGEETSDSGLVPDAERTVKRKGPAVTLRTGFGAALLAVIVVAVLLWWLWWPAAGKSSTANATPDVTSIAVLPFESLSADPDNAYFVQGIRDTILTRLATVDSFQVVSRTASDRYTSHPKNLSVVAEQLQVEAVLEGSVQKAGQEVLINLQLIDPESGTHLWAESYIRNMKDIFAVETDVATKVAATLSRTLQPSEIARLGHSPTTDPKAYLLYLKANYLARRVLTLANVEDPAAAVSSAAALYRRAIARDPDFARAWARLSLLKSKAYWFLIDESKQSAAAAWEAANQAVKLAPNLPQAHIALGYAYYYVKRDYAAALDQFKSARESLPYNARIVAAIAYIHRRQAKWNEALTELRKAAALDPGNPKWRNQTGQTLMFLRRYPEAIHSFNQAIAIAPDDNEAKMRKVNALLLFGKLEQAREVVSTIPKAIDPQGFITSLRFDIARISRKPKAALAILEASKGLHTARALKADALMLAGKREAALTQYREASRKLRATLEKQPKDPFAWSALGLAQAALGNKEAAIKAGEQAVSLNPISKDVVAGSWFLTRLAKIYARLGMAKESVKLIDRLMSIPAGSNISVASLRLDPVWDPIRGDPRFQALIEKYGEQAPPEATH
ncbi:MAG: winged helix-turn-helix domain-containing protein [Gammaproteobacteria bacterium]|nr:winged helix-turn-helix domain-containing protein [Gammaproteobacteria bacterium]